MRESDEVNSAMEFDSLGIDLHTDDDLKSLVQEAEEAFNVYVQRSASG